MVCGYNCSCLRKLTPLISGCYHLGHFPLCQFILFSKLLGRNPLGRIWGVGIWKGNINIIGVDKPPQSLFFAVCYRLGIFVPENEEGTSVGERNCQHWIAVNSYLKVSQFDLIEQVYLLGECMRIRRKLKAVDKSSREKETWLYAQISQNLI